MPPSRSSSSSGGVTAEQCDERIMKLLELKQRVKGVGMQGSQQGQKEPPLPPLPTHRKPPQPILCRYAGNENMSECRQLATGYIRMQGKKQKSKTEVCDVCKRFCIKHFGAAAISGGISQPDDAEERLQGAVADLKEKELRNKLKKMQEHRRAEGGSDPENDKDRDVSRSRSPITASEAS